MNIKDDKILKIRNNSEKEWWEMFNKFIKELEKENKN